MTTTYKKDKFEKSIILYEELIRRLKEYGEYDIVKKGLSNFFLGYVRTVIKQESNNNVALKEQLKRIKEIVRNKYVINAIKDKQYESISREIYDLFIKLKMTIPLYVFSKIKK